MSQCRSRTIGDRDWSKYNEELVIRGEFYLDLGFRDEWFSELGKMNDSKRGEQFLFPESFVKWLTVWKQLVDYRGLEGISRRLNQLGLIPRHPDYTTIWTRIHSLTPEISVPDFNPNLALLYYYMFWRLHKSLDFSVYVCSNNTQHPKRPKIDHKPRQIGTSVKNVVIH